RAAAARHHCGNAGIRLGRGGERGGGAGAGPEIAGGEPRRLRLLPDPARGGGETRGEEPDVEDVGPFGLLLRLQQVEQKSRQSGTAKLIGDVVVAGTEAAAAAAMSEDDDAVRSSGHAN